MPLIQLLGALIVISVLLWLVNRFIPMARSIKSILNGVVVIGVVALQRLWIVPLPLANPSWVMSEQTRFRRS
jgi:hypothetical protein